MSRARAPLPLATSPIRGRHIRLLVTGAVAVMAAACATPLANRTARAVPVGKAELAANVSTVVPRSPGADIREGLIAIPMVEVSARWGILDRVDAQLRLDTQLFPEVSMGYQFLGDSDDDANHDIAAAVAIGGRFAMLPSLGLLSEGPQIASLSIPVELLVDVPLGDLTLTIASRNVVTGLIGDGGSLGLAPGLGGALTIPITDDGFFVRAEVAGNYPIPLFGDSKLLLSQDIIYLGGSVGVGGVFGGDDTPPSKP